MLQFIDIGKLFPHPNNPRKDLGDLTELADSIRAKGILKNLTVVPYNLVEKDQSNWDDDYDRFVVVIGHRRLAAAKLAGLETIPCAIAEMNEQEQIAVMLLENMQRNDLTVYEQAQAFQMLLDFGESINYISEKTGFSQTTVRRRVKLLEPDQEKFKDAVARGGTLFDFAELDKIKSAELKNKVMESIGTPNFQNNLQRAIDQEKKEAWYADAIEKLKTFATESKDTPKECRYVTSYVYFNDKEVDIPADADEVKYFYVVSQYGYITLYAETQQTDKDDAAAKEQEALMKAKLKELEEISKRAYGLRKEFVRSISNAKAKKRMRVIAEYLTSALSGNYVEINKALMADLLGISLSDENIIEELRKQPERYMLVAVYCLLDEERQRYYYANLGHSRNPYLDKVYDFLADLGYQISDEEQEVRDGTHELFQVDSVVDI